MSSNRLIEWNDFAKKVGNHVETYTVPQWGDWPHDKATDYSVHDIKRELEKYVARIGRGVRGQAEAERDCYKIAHYACMLLTRI